MEWDSIKIFFLENVFGVLLLGALGSIIGFLILKLVGITYPQFKRLRLFYLKGIEEIKNELVDSPYKLKKVIFKIQIRTMHICLLTGLSILLVILIYAFQGDIYSVFIISMIIGALWIYLNIYYSIIYSVFNELSKRDDQS